MLEKMDERVTDIDKTEYDQAVIDFMKARRSVPAKTMGGPGPDDETLREIVAIAARVPDHGKIAPWRFVRYSQETCNKLNERIAARARELNPGISDAEMEIEETRFSRSPVIVGIISAPVDHPKVPHWEQVLSSAAAAMNMLIAANAHGFDAQWLSEWIARDEVLAPHFGVGEGETLTGFIHMGTRTMPKTDRDRPDIERVYVTM
ncbi:MAG: nitroreductase [Nitratireductor sp.]|nr:nitroreductase [Nitratireductor sp.]